MREHHEPRRPRRLVSAAVLASAFVLSACSGDQSALHPAGRFAQEPHDLITLVAILALVVFVFVQGLLIVSVVKFRVRRDDDGTLPVQVHGNTKLEIVWTVIPAVILAVIAVPTVQLIFGMMDEPEEEFLTVEVIGHRWWFEYYYPDYDIFTANEMAIPAGTPVRLQMTAADPGHSQDRAVVHSFWIPSLAGKQDLVPNHTTYLNIEADEPGRYIGQCAEYCGLSHVNMRARVNALDEADWQTWIDEQTSPAQAPENGLAAEGRELFHDLGDDRQACASCHQVWEGDGSRGPSQGPDLTHLMSRSEFAGAIADLDEESLRQWVADPNTIKPMQYEANGVGMPDVGLSDDEVDAVVAYLLTLQ